MAAGGGGGAGEHQLHHHQHQHGDLVSLASGGGENPVPAGPPVPPAEPHVSATLVGDVPVAPQVGSASLTCRPSSFIVDPADEREPGLPASRNLCLSSSCVEALFAPISGRVYPMIVWCVNGREGVCSLIFPVEQLSGLRMKPCHEPPFGHLNLTLADAAVLMTAILD